MATTKAKGPASIAAAAGTEKVTSKAQAEAASPLPFFAGYGELADLGRESFAAAVKANAVMSEGWEAWGREMIGYAKASFEKAAQTTAALLAAKSLEDVVQVNNEFVQTSVESMIKRSAKLSEVSMKVFEAWAPVGSRVEAVAAKLAKASVA